MTTKFVISDSSISAPDIITTSTQVRIKDEIIQNIPNIQPQITQNTNNISTNTTNISAIQTEIDQFSDELKNLTISEIQQLENINSNIISNTQWNYISNMDQNISTSSNVNFNKLRINDNGSIVQTTSISTSVTINNQKGTIQTVSYTSLLGGSNTFTVNNTYCQSTSIVILQPVSYSGTGGNPTYFISAINNNSFDITIRNFNTLVGINGFHIIKYIVL